MKKLLNKYIPLCYGLYFNTLAIFSKKKAAKKAFELFCTPRKGRVLPQQKDFLDAAKVEKIEADGVHFQTYHWPGNKDTVLLLHGWESNSFRWRNLITFLKKEQFNIIAVDAPAHGYSTSKTFTAPLYVKGIKPAVEEYKPRHIIAHSIGGMSALYFHHKYPNASVEKIVTLGSPSDFSIIVKGYQDFLALNKKVMNAMDEHFFKLFGFRMNEFSTSRFSEKFDIDGLLIHDELDKVAPVNGSEKVHANWANSILFKTKGLGHSLHQDEVSTQIVDFLKS